MAELAQLLTLDTTSRPWRCSVGSLDRLVANCNGLAHRICHCYVSGRVLHHTSCDCFCLFVEHVRCNTDLYPPREAADIGQLWALCTKPLTPAGNACALFRFYHALAQEITNGTIAQVDGVTTLTFVRPLEPTGDGKQVRAP